MSSPSPPSPPPVQPREGDVLWFHNVSPDGEGDHLAAHTACPVVKGVKWTATKWIRAKKFGVQQAPKPGECADLNESCAGWASDGECDKNPGFMVGNPGGAQGSCMLSCKKCKPGQVLGGGGGNVNVNAILSGAIGSGGGGLR